MFSRPPVGREPEPLPVALNPCGNNRQHISLLASIKRHSLGQTMPFVQTPPAACAGGMLCDKNRMPFPRCLPSIPRGMRRGKAFCNEVLPVKQNSVFPLFLQIGSLLRAR